MSLADAFSDAVADIDGYLHEARSDPWFSGHPSHPWYQRVVACRNEMEHVRVLLDRVGLGLSPDDSGPSYRPYDPDASEGEPDVS